MRTRLQSYRLARPLGYALAALLAVSLLAPLANAQGTLVVDDGEADDAVGDAANFLWFNIFTPPEQDYPLAITNVQVGFGSTGVDVGAPVDLYIWEDLDGDGDPGTSATLLATTRETVQFADTQTLSSYDLEDPVVLSSPGDVLIGAVYRGPVGGFPPTFSAAFDADTDCGCSWFASYEESGAPVDPPDLPTLPSNNAWLLVSEAIDQDATWMIRASYDANVSVAIAPDPNGQSGAHALSAVYPNPIISTGRVALEVAEPQDIRIAVYDILGREVARLHDGPLSPGAAHEFVLEAHGLLNGLYLVRVTGEQITDTRQFTLTR